MPDTLTGRLNARDRDRDLPSISAGKTKWIRPALCRVARGARARFTDGVREHPRRRTHPGASTDNVGTRFSTTNAMYESLGLCHCFLFSGLVEYYFPRDASKYTHTHNPHTQHTHTHTQAQAFVIGSIICRFLEKKRGICGKDYIDYFIDF